MGLRRFGDVSGKILSTARISGWAEPKKQRIFNDTPKPVSGHVDFAGEKCHGLVVSCRVML